MPDRRFYVSLTATCTDQQLTTVLADMQEAMSAVADSSALDGLSLSFTRDDVEDYSAETVALPIVPDPGSGPVAPPADPGRHVAEQTLPTAPVAIDTDGSPR